MSDEERLKWLKEIEKDIFVCSLESTFVEDAKSCAIHSAIELLENQKTGHWKSTTHYARPYRVCSVCDCERIDDHSTGWNYCPNCGAKMKGE